MQAIGLRTHIWNNQLKSLVLLAGFPVLLLLICFAFGLIIVSGDDPSFAEGLQRAAAMVPTIAVFAILIAAAWFAIAYFLNRKIVDLLTGAREISRKDEIRVWNLLENLAISRGQPVPTLRIIEVPALNAFASGIRDGHYSVTVTRGLIDTLDDAELEAVLAHELTHILNKDTQLLVVSSVFVGIISIVADMFSRGMRYGRSSSSSSGKKGKGGGIFLILLALLIFVLARFLAIAIRFALSRRREYMADAGSVELTKNPDAMASALRKIEGRSKVSAPPLVSAMFFDEEPASRAASAWSTHPSIQERIDALVQYAGARDPGPRPPDPEPEATEETQEAATTASGESALVEPGPWGPPSQDGRTGDATSTSPAPLIPEGAKP